MDLLIPAAAADQESEARQHGQPCARFRNGDQGDIIGHVIGVGAGEIRGVGELEVAAFKEDIGGIEWVAIHGGKGAGDRGRAVIGDQIKEIARVEARRTLESQFQIGSRQINRAAGDDLIVSRFAARGDAADLQVEMRSRGQGKRSG